MCIPFRVEGVRGGGEQGVRGRGGGGGEREVGRKRRKDFGGYVGWNGVVDLVGVIGDGLFKDG